MLTMTGAIETPRKFKNLTEAKKFLDTNFPCDRTKTVYLVDAKGNVKYRLRVLGCRWTRA